jgi:glycerol kinase
MTADPHNGALYLCLDQGGHASRALVIDCHGDIRAQAFTAINTIRSGDRVEHDPLELLDSLRSAADAAVRQLGGDAKRLVAAGLATQRSSIVCWDRRSAVPLTPVLSWQDTRASQWLEGFAEQWAHVHAITGLALSPHYGVSKLMWCLEHEPAVAAAARSGHLCGGPLAAYLARGLTGSQADLADPANASRTLLWDRHTRDWSADLLALFGVDPEWLPRTVNSRHDWGELELGSQRVPLTVVTGDQSAALFAFGQPAPATAFVNMGTGAFMQRRAPAAEPATGRLLASVVYADAAAAIGIVEGTVNGAGSALAKVSGDYGLDKDSLHANSADWLRNVVDAPLFFNTVSGLGSPWWRTGVAPRFSREADVDAAIVAVLESIAFLLAVNFDYMSERLGSADEIVVTGGLGSVDPLLQRLADLTGCTVARADVREATATGLAFLLAGLPQAWPKAQLERVFAPAQNVELRARYLDWLEGMPVVPE